VARALSTDHKPSDFGELKRIKGAGGVVLMSRVQGILAVSRAIGDLFFKNKDNLPAKD